MIKKLFFTSIILSFFALGLNAQQTKDLKTDTATTSIKNEKRLKTNIVFTAKLNQPKVFAHENSPMRGKSNKAVIKQKAIQKKEQ